MTIFWWIAAIVGLVAGVVILSLCAMSSQCARREEAMDRELAGGAKGKEG